MEEEMNWNATFLKLINKTLGVSIRTQVIKGNPWFVAKDICEALALGDTSKAVARLNDDEKDTNNVLTPGGMQTMLIVNEAGLYHLILTSRKPEAIEFRRWITHKVLPALRMYGSYIMEEEEALSGITDETRRLLDGYRSLSASDRQLIDFIINRNRA